MNPKVGPSNLEKLLDSLYNRYIFSIFILLFNFNINQTINQTKKFKGINKFIMSPKAKKSLILSGIIGGAVAAPILLPLIPYAVQHTLVNKEIKNNPKAFFDRRVENAIADSGLDTKVADLGEAIKALEADYNALEDKTTPEAQAKKAELDTKKEELEKTKAELEKVKTEATYKATEVLAQLGDATINKENEKYTAQYVVLAYADFKASLEKLGETVDVNYPNKEDVEKISEFYQS
ncbi:Uncharacterised protein [Chlamydia trachomatis]|nr:Uncharacterised protein [Chlamydia trachomatis]CRH55456.1 Uncharacterised protein [Chlamydia trachomatis]CRH56739.1 Uncharacterised protein [Chlamydia trachomatis]